MIRVADEAEMAEAPLEQVFRRQPTHRDVVHPDAGDRQVGQHSGDVDDRHPRLDQGVGQLAVEDVGDHPVLVERAHRAHGTRLGAIGVKTQCGRVSANALIPRRISR